MDTLDKLVRSMQRRRGAHERSYHLLLTGQANQQNLYHGYKSLAALLCIGYFSLVLTTNDEMLLEQALQERGRTDYKVVNVGYDPDYTVATILDGLEDGICIVRFCVDKKIPLADEVQYSLQSYLQQNIVIVGYINDTHQEMIQALTVKKDNSVYYVVPAKLASDPVSNLLQKQHQKQESFLVDGPNGEFATFFDNLVARLVYSDALATKPDSSFDKKHPLQSKQTLSPSTKNMPESHRVKLPEAAPQARKEETLQPICSEARPQRAVAPLGALPQPCGRVQQVFLGAQPESEWRKDSSLLGTVSQVSREEVLQRALPEVQPERQWRSNSGLLEYEPSKSGPLEMGSLADMQSHAIRQLPWPDENTVLIVTVTNVELKAFLDRYPGRVRRTPGRKTYYDLGRVGCVRTLVVQSNGMGPLAAQTTVYEGIREFSPRAVIMVGIAFGARVKEQQIGDILVSELIHDYDLERVGTGENEQLLSHPRGTRVRASDWLVDRFHAGSNDWSAPPAIHFGAILSGSKLVDNKEYHRGLLRPVPEAIGGEMEGVGFSAAADYYKVDWLLVKGISDWADGAKSTNKRSYQQLAADNAAGFVLFVMEQEDFMHKL